MSLLQPLIRNDKFQAVSALTLQALTRTQNHAPVTRLGTPYGGWWVPLDLLTEDSVCYLAGVGEDASFDIELIQAIGCRVHALDPTPRSIEFTKTITEPNFHFVPVGLWDTDGPTRFFSPRNPLHVSHSAVNAQGSSQFVELECLTLPSLMRQLGHSRVDLLKLDIEGAEWRVLRHAFASGILPTVLCLEFDEPEMPWATLRKIRHLRERGYAMLHREGRNFTFLHSSSPAGSRT